MARSRVRPQAPPRALRQGDVLLVPVRSLPQGTRIVPRDHGRVIIAYGEVTGHAHAIMEEDVTLATLDDAASRAAAARALLAEVGLTVEVTDEQVIGFVDVPSPAALVHDEHGTIPLAVAPYVALRQREWTDADEPILVAD